MMIDPINKPFLKLKYFSVILFNRITLPKNRDYLKTFRDRLKFHKTIFFNFIYIYSSLSFYNYFDYFI